MLVGTLWFRKFLKQRRAEAFFGFYSSLMLQIKSIRVWLEEKDMLKVGTQDGNIYAHMYVPGLEKDESLLFQRLEDKQFDELNELLKDLKELLLKSENNVYPKGFKKKLWYESQHTLLTFCNFIALGSMREDTNIPKYSNGNNSGQYKHIVKCKELIAAMDSIQTSIENANY